MAIVDPFKSSAPAGGIVDPFAAPAAAPAAPAIQRPKSGLLRRTVGDTAVDLGRGVVGVGEAVAGLANLASFGGAGKAFDAVGFDPERAKGMIGELYSPERQAAQQAVSEADGFVDTAKAMIQNPSTIAGTVAESLPSMLGGGAIGQAVRRVVPRLGAIGAAALGEGAIGAGQSAESIRQQTPDGELSGTQALAALGSGVGTAALGAGGGALARRLGIADPDVIAAGGDLAGVIRRPGSTAARVARGAGAGAVSEGVFEELPQSMQEQAWQNFALERPLGEGVPEAAAAGLLTGAAMGGPVGGVSAAIARPGSLTDAAQAVQQPTAEQPGPEQPAAAPQQGPTLALPSPVIRVRADGKAASESTIFQRQQQRDERDAANAALGLTPDVNAARARHPGAVPNTGRYPIARPGSLADAANAMPAAPAAAAGPANAGMFERIAAERAGKPLPRRDETGSAAYEERDVSTGDLDADMRAPAPVNLDPDTGEELGIDAERWPVALDHQQPAAIVSALKAQAAQNKNKPAGVTAIAQTFNVSKDTARALRNRALDEMNAEAGNSRRLGPPEATAGGASSAAPGAAAPAEPSGADAQPAAPAAPATAPAAREAVAGEGEGGAQRPLQGDRGQDTAVQPEQAVYDESEELLDSDIGAPSGGPYTIRDAAERVAARTEGGRVFPVGAGFVVRTPRAAQEAPAQAPAPAAAGAATAPVEQAEEVSAADYAALRNRNRTPAAVPGDTWDTGAVLRDKPVGGTIIIEGAQTAENPDGGVRWTKQANGQWTDGKSTVDHDAMVRLSDEVGETIDAAPAQQLATRANAAATSPLNDRPEPTQAQKEAGNYAKGHVRINGHDISVENPAGSRRNPKWPKLKDHYGYIRGTVGRDKDHVDVFMTENAGDAARPVFVVDQLNKDGSFDEHKVVMGAADEAEARAAYQRNYSKGWSGLGAITEMSQDEFKDWVRDPKKTARPAARKALKKPDAPATGTAIDGARPALAVRMGGNEYAVASYEDASEKFRELRSTVDIGGMSVVELVDQAGRPVGWIGPKGEVYEGNFQERRASRDDVAPVYRPPAGEALPDPSIIDGEATRVEPDRSPLEELRTDRAFRAALKTIGDPHIESESASAAARGWDDAKAGRWADDTRMVDVAGLKGRHDPVDSYISGYLAGKGLELGEVRARSAAQFYLAHGREGVAATDGRASAQPETVDNRPQEAPADASPAQAERVSEQRPSDGAGDVSARRRDRQPVDAGVAADGAGAAGQPGLFEGAPDAGGTGARGAVAGSEPAAPGPARSDAGAGAEPGTADPVDFDLTGEELGTGGLAAKYRDNIAAIRILKAMAAAGRVATPEERKQIARYVGWGALKGVFDPANKQWSKQHAELKDLLTTAEYEAARASTRNAHFTSQDVVAPMLAGLQRLGFTRGRLLEPSMGTGNFFGMMPARMRGAADLYGVELDPLTSQIAAALYPSARVTNSGFEAYSVPGGFFDAAIGNPPFGEEPIVDADRTPYSGFSIHNYFLAKTIDKLRPGGVAMMVVSHNFLDAKDNRARKWIADRASLVSAVRLPDTAFKGNAGTEVVTDVLVFQKHDQNALPADDRAWVDVGEQVNENPKTGETAKHQVNRYFLANPGQVLGTPTAEGKMYRANDYTVKETGKLRPQLEAWAKGLPEGIYTPINRTEKMQAAEVPEGTKVGNFYMDAAGKIMQRGEDVAGARSSRAWEAPNAKAAERMAGMIRLRNLLRRQMVLERDPDATEKKIEDNRKKLNEAYDGFLKEHGYLNAPVNRRLFLDDSDSDLLQALEFDYDNGLSKAVADREGVPARPPFATKADIFSRRVAFPQNDQQKVQSAQDAMIASLNYRGHLSLPYMESIYDKDADAIVKELGDLVYRTPEGTLETADEYLSGDVKTKLAEAEAAAADDPALKRNVEALKKVIPRDKTPSEVHVSLGAHFVPDKIVADFVEDLTGGRPGVGYARALGRWMLSAPATTDQVLMRSTWGTPDMSALDILKHTIDGKAVVVTKVIREGDSMRTIVLEAETEAAREKQNAIRQEWRSWLWRDPDRADAVLKAYNEQMNRVVPRSYDGSHLTLPGKNPGITLLKHQLDGIWRGLQSRQILLDHAVGAGKTFQIAGMVMEMRRLGIARKPVLAVPNHLTLQWRSEFTRLYPGSRVLAATPEDFSKQNRPKLFSKIVTGDWDAVILGHSSLKRIGLPPEMEAEILKEQVDELSESIEEMKRERGDRNIIRDMEGIRKTLEAKMKDRAAAAGPRDDVLTFDELGLDALGIDELHEFKNLTYTSTMTKVPGMGNPKGSARAFDLFMKTQWLFRTFGDKAPLITATGTPVSNSLVEMFNVQRFMQYPTLKAHGTHLFDAWARAYGSIESVYEVAPSGSGFRSSNRFAKFQNLSSLMNDYTSFADIVTLDDLKRQEEAAGKRFPVPRMKGGRPALVVAPRSEQVADLMGVPALARGEDGEPTFRLDLRRGDTFAIEQKDDRHVLTVQKAGEGSGYPLHLGTYDNVEEARAAAVEAGLTPEISLDRESILGRFARLRELTKETEGKVNALSLTGEANKAGLDFRLINPAAPDFPDSKVNKAVANILAEWKAWKKGKGTQLVFLDMSVPLSARNAMASKPKRAYVRDTDGALIHKRATLHATQGAEELPFFVVEAKAKTKDRPAEFAVYDAATGHPMRAEFTNRAGARQWADEELATPAGRQRWIVARGKSPELQQEDIDDYNDANEIDASEADAAFALQDIAGASGAAGFSIYDDMKAKLVAAGVPEREIAFIHDYDTPTAKAKLFRAVNAGEVRIMFGSTPKMGAGTNVQERVVALHHIDAPWKPSDLEQREGRVIRRGNRLYDADPDGFEVGIYRYATEQTYDARRWQILEHKARGIEQLRMFDGTMNEIEDIDGEAANAADMKAAASGDPLILRETQLRNELRRLENLEVAHADNAVAAGRAARQATLNADRYLPQRAAAIDEIRAGVQPDVKDGVPKGSTVAGKKFADRKDYTKALASSIGPRIEEVHAGIAITPFDVTWRGVRFTVGRSDFGGALVVSSNLGDVLSVHKGDTFSASGLVTRMNNLVDRLDAMRQRVDADIAEERSKAARFTEASKAPFPDAALLASTRRDYRAVQRTLLLKGPNLQEKDKAALERALEGQREALREAGLGDALDEMLAGTAGDPAPAAPADEPAAGAALRARWTADFDAVWTEYAALSGEFDTEGGRVLNTDLARELSPEYRANRGLSADVHDAASDFVKEAYRRKLSQPTPAGLYPDVVLSAGGTGAGKSTGLRSAGPAMARAEIVYDTNSNRIESAVEKIEAALAADRNVQIVYTYRDPVEALRRGALPRAARLEQEFGSGRTVPLAEHARTHVGSGLTIRELVSRYGDDPRVHITLIDNSRGKGAAAVVDLENLPAPAQDGLDERLASELEAAYQAGEVSDAIRAGFVQESRRPAVARDRGESQEEVRAQVAGGTPEQAPAPAVRFSKAPGSNAPGLTFARAIQVKAELTGQWGENAPSVVLVESAEDLPAFAKADPDYRRAEGLWGGRQTVWINVGGIPTEKRLAEVLAHEAIGHFGVEAVVGRGEWTGIVSAITNHDRNGTGADSLKRAMRAVHRRYGPLDPESFAKETIAVMAEQGARNGLLARVVAAVRRWLRQHMPALPWTDADVVALLGQADSFLHAGRTQAERREAVGALAFSRPDVRLEMDGRGARRIQMGGETFLEVGRRFYMVNGTGRPKDFLTVGAATEAAQRAGGQVVFNDPIEGERPSWSVVVPETTARAAGAERPLFSKAPADVLADIDAVMSDSHREGAFERAKQWLKDATPKKIKDELRGTWLGALTTRHLTELGADYFQNIRHYSDFLAQQQADRNKLSTDGEAIAESARKWAGKNRAEARRLFDLMHQATIDGVDPAEGYKPLSFQYGGQVYEATQKNVKDALRAIREQMLGRAGDNKKDMMAEARHIRGLPAREKRRRAKYPALVQRWNELTPEARTIYQQFRDSYAERSSQIEKALVARINDTDAPENHKRRLVNTIRMQFETQRMQGVYFPLQRFGRYFVAAEKGDANTFLMFERLGELERAVKNLKSRGFKITAQGLKSEGKAKDAPSGSFVAEVMDQLRKSGVSDQTQDQIYQLYLQALPELSMRKHSIHRKVVPGFDPDAVRAFAFNMHHGAHQLARLRWAHKMQDVLTLLKQQQDNARREEGADTRKIAAGDAILEELNKRDEWINNPQDSNLTNLVSSFGFAWYLGGTPAAALVNLTQTGMVSYPWLAARYGAAKSMNALLSAGGAAIRTVGNIQRTLTDPEDQQAHAVLQQMGAIDKTQAHNLAGIAEGGLTGYNPKWAKAMEIIGLAFHKAEVVNRETTGMAAFRLARAAGESFEQAVKTAADAIYDTHFDYSNANRARFMQSGAAKVLLMFRQYSLNMTWHLARTAWQATKGQDPEVRRIARRNIAGVLGMAGVMAGVLGLPMVKLSMGVLNAVAASAGDDDEPWDAETEFRAFLTDMLGATVADLILTGPTNALTGADIHSRVGLSDLWFRDADRELDGRGQYYHLLETAAGPMGGVLKSLLVGKSMIDEGHTWRGVETMLPKALKDMVKAARYSTEGVNNLRGDALLEDPSLWQALLQLQGFTPAEVAKRYDTNRALKNYEQHILDRRQHLMNSLAMAFRLEDPEARADAMAAIAKFNRAHPEIGITPASIRKSIQSRARYSAKAEAGIMLNPKIAAKVRDQVGVE